MKQLLLICAVGALVGLVRCRRKNGTPGRTRTYNQLIKSQLLYQLSYRGDRGK